MRWYQISDFNTSCPLCIKEYIRTCWWDICKFRQIWASSILFPRLSLCISRIDSIRFEDSFLSFRNYNEHTLSDLINNEITVCSPRVLNDPYDTLLLKWGEYIRTKMADKKHINPFCDAFHSYRIRAFAKVIGQSGKEMISNTLMWSHYA